MAAKRPHSKSRTGCDECKLRRIKVIDPVTTSQQQSAFTNISSAMRIVPLAVDATEEDPNAYTRTTASDGRPDSGRRERSLSRLPVVRCQ